MIRMTAVPRPVRVSAALAGVAGLLTLTACATDPAAAEESTDAPTTGSSTPSSGESATSYADGTYTSEGSYQTPESVETISVTVTLEDDIIAAVDVSGDPQARESQQYQSAFIGGIAEVVVGQDIDEISVSRVAGSSLTSGGFNAAIEAIKSEAAA